MCENLGGFELDRDCEKYGFLFKRSPQNKRQNKFCLLKDNFIFWYKEDEYVKIKKTKYFNSKPQGIIYLNNCIVREYIDNTQSFSFIIENCAFQRPVIFTADCQITRDAWIEKMTFNSNINYHNILDTQRFVKELMDTSSTLKYTMVKRQFNDVRYENESLVKLKEQLEKDNEDKEKCLTELQLEFSKVKDEVDDAYKIMHNLQNSKSILEEKNLSLENELQQLDLERMKTTEMMYLETHMDNEVVEMQKKLEEISHLKEKIDQDRNDIKQKLSEREDMSNYLEQENLRIINQAQELNTLINKLKNENLDIERKLEIERTARIEAENRLRDADLSLARLHNNIVDGGTKYTDEEKKEMTTDVNKLKDYFEDVIRAQAQPFPKYSSKSKCNLKQNSNSTNQELHDNAKLGNFCTETSIRVREQSKRIREEHRMRISMINWDQ